MTEHNTDKLPIFAHRDEKGRVIIARTLASIQVTPWIQRLLEIVAAIEGVSVREAIGSHLPADEYMVCGDGRDLLPASFYPLIDEEDATDAQIACAAFDHGFQSKLDTLWGDADDHLYVTALEHALANRFAEMGVVVTRKILANVLSETS